MTKKSKPLIITHSEAFQPDDVFAVAALRILLNGECDILRTREEALFSKGDYVVDVGGVYDPETNRFDHHQTGGAGKRENGIPYSAFALVWRTYGEQLCGSKTVADVIEKKLVVVIDMDDNGIPSFTSTCEDIEPYTIESLIYSLIPAWNEDHDVDVHFLRAVNIAEVVLERLIIRENAKVEARAVVEEIYKNTKDKRLIVFNERVTWGDTLKDFPEPLFVVQPARDADKWRVETIGLGWGQEKFKNRKLLPVSWAGKRDLELQKETGVSDALFCHNLRFVAGAVSKEGAIKMAQLAIEAAE